MYNLKDTEDSQENSSIDIFFSRADSRQILAFCRDHLIQLRNFLQLLSVQLGFFISPSENLREELG